MITLCTPHEHSTEWSQRSVACLCVLEPVYKTLTSLSSWAAYYNELRCRKGRTGNKHRHVREPCNHVKLYNTKGYPRRKSSLTRSPVVPKLLRASNLILLRSEKAGADPSAKRHEIPCDENTFLHKHTRYLPN